jgi:hypothetical protein
MIVFELEPFELVVVSVGCKLLDGVDVGVVIFSFIAHNSPEIPSYPQNVLSEHDSRMGI